MKNKKILLAAILGLMLALLISGCGPTGGTITVVNESSYQLTNVKISLGKSQVDELDPGEWMRASVDKDIMGANVSFSLGTIMPNSEKGKDLVQVPGFGDSWLASTTFNSSLISVNGGEAIIVTVKNK